MKEDLQLRQQLEKEGWEKRTVTNEPRLSELIELYEELDLEVKTIPSSPEDFEGCSICFDADSDRYRTIYTRPRDRAKG